MIAAASDPGDAGALALIGLTAAASAQSLPPAATAPFDLLRDDALLVAGLLRPRRRGQVARAMRGRRRRRLRRPRPLARQPQRARIRKTAARPEPVGRRARRRRAASIPTTGLARYEYRKHGTCTGLSARDYFAAVRYVRDQLDDPCRCSRRPRQAQRLSPRGDRAGLHRRQRQSQPDNMAVTCARGELVDVRFCLTTRPQGLRDLSESPPGTPVSAPRSPSSRCVESPSAAWTTAWAGRAHMNYRHAFHAGNFADVFKHASSPASSSI